MNSLNPRVVSPDASSIRNLTLHIVLAFVAIYLIWGTTYLAMRIAVATIPPFVIVGIRFGLAGGLLMTYLALRGSALPTRKQWLASAFTGALLICGGNGLVMWAVQKIPSGICALVVATMPIWMTLFDYFFFKGTRPGIRVIFGLLLGLIGIVLLLGPQQLLAGETALHLPSMLVLLCAPICWSLGSLFSRQIDLPANVYMSTAAQMLCGGLLMTGVSLVSGEAASIVLSSIAWESLLAVLYLIFLGSIVALTSYMWLLKNVDASRVATYTYVNPVIAVFLGWLILSEAINARIIVAVIAIVLAVVLIVTRPQTGSSSNPDQTG